MRSWPAVDFHEPPDADLLLAVLDDYHPTAIEERGADVRAFFSDPAERDAARRALAAQFRLTPVDVPDEEWARRSQENLAPVTVGRIRIVPDLQLQLKPSFDDARDDPAMTVVIRPSMGFGTGHHATTRLCLAALQAIDLSGRFVLDVGTGSGVLALAARRLGAGEALGIDVDADAIRSARENVALNPGVDNVRFELQDLQHPALPAADVITANLTGALLRRSSRHLISRLRPGGVLILGGLQSAERREVFDAFAPLELAWEREEDGWVGARFNHFTGAAV
jgi:ribosomal protein L11 methyltransferase